MSARVNPHKSWSRLSAARQRKAANVERKGLRLIGKRGADASKGERLRRRGVTSGTGKMFRGGTHTEGPTGRLPNPRRKTDAEIKRMQLTAQRAQTQALAVSQRFGYGSARHQAAETAYKTASQRFQRARAKANPTPNEWDDETLNEAARLGSAQARALGKAERAGRAGPRFFNVTWFSPTRQKRVGFIRPIEAMSAADAKRQAKVMITNEKAVNIVAKEARGNPDFERFDPRWLAWLRGLTVAELAAELRKHRANALEANAIRAIITEKDRKNRNPGIMEIAGGLQALDYLGEKVGVGGKKRKNPRAKKPKESTPPWTCPKCLKAYRYTPQRHYCSGIPGKAYKSNPSVNEMSERFQGRATGKTEDYYFSDSAPRLDMSRGGKLVFLKIKGTTIRVPASVVAIDPKSEKLWLGSKGATGMFQRKARFGERLDYGDVDAICYLTAKTHIEKGKLIEYVHTFGEDGGRKPRLLIDHEGMPILQGGDYKIEDRGIVN